MSDSTPKNGGEQSEDMVDRFLRLPASWQLGGVLVLVVIAILVAQEHVWPTADRWNEEADQIERTLTNARNLDRGLPPSIERIAVALGPIEVPRSAAPGATRLEETVGEICLKHNLVPKIDGRTGSRLPPNNPISAMAGGRVDRLVCEMEFTATPDLLIKVLRDLESEPEIESIADLRLDRINDGPELDVTLVVEAWIVPAQGGRSR